MILGLLNQSPGTLALEIMTDSSDEDSDDELEKLIKQKEEEEE
eukprot:SAG11_NODE_2142_length_3755_cov_211.276805_2_plen_42_part_01